MKAITTNSISSSLDADRRTLKTRIRTAREVIHMNLISNIMIKDKDIKKSLKDNKSYDENQDHGLNLYRTLEFSKDHSKKTNHNMHFEMVCNRLI
ncbi:MAG: hypothetical protein A2Y23_15070 [Clostridiales bacterium GWB2_37_7]|nr:MAG: hypothetical protein A2Y23_15070 [Clostridiales bacterium GWB2_37_7]